MAVQLILSESIYLVCLQIQLGQKFSICFCDYKSHPLFRLIWEKFSLYISFQIKQEWNFKSESDFRLFSQPWHFRLLLQFSSKWSNISKKNKPLFFSICWNGASQKRMGMFARADQLWNFQLKRMKKFGKQRFFVESSRN